MDLFLFVRNILVIISGVCWSCVYADSIRTGFKQKTYCMPLFALGLNIAWEGIYSFSYFFIRKEICAQAFANAAWFILDIFLVVTFLKYGKAEEAKNELHKKFFIPYTILAIACCFVLQFLFIYEFGLVEGEKYSAFLQNIIMSICYLYMLDSRKSSRGQTMLIAWCKCIGTLTPTIIGAMENNLFIVVTGIICFIFDAMYIYFLNYVKKKERTK